MNQLLSYFIEEKDYILAKWSEHLILTLISLLIALIAALILAIAATRPGREKTGKMIITIAGAMQSIPSIAVIAAAFLAFGIGAVPAIIALTLYCIVPILFNTVSAISSIDSQIKEAAAGMGMTETQILYQVELALALPPIIAGTRNASVMAVGSATIATAIGAGGLGEIIFRGLALFDNNVILAGALPVSLTAIMLDLLFDILGRCFTSPGLKYQK